MQKKHLMAGSAIGGFLLATTALTSTASAQNLLVASDDAFGPSDTDNVGGLFAAERFVGSAASTLTIGSFDVVYDLGGSFENGTVRLQIDTNIGSFISGIAAGSVASAAFADSAAAVAGSNAAVASAVGSATSVTTSSLSAFGGQINVTYVLPASSPVLSLAIESLKLGQVQALSAANTALTLTSNLFTADSGTSSATDTLTLGTSGATHTMSISAASALTANSTASPPFSGFEDGSGGSTVTGTLATVNVVGGSAQNRALTGTETVSDLISATGGLSVSATSDLLAQSGVTRAQVVVGGGSTTVVSTGAISAAGAFTLDNVGLGGFGAGTTSVAIQVVFDASSAIETADAGTSGATLVGTATSALVTATGTTAAVQRNGITAEVNYFQGSGDSFGGAEGAFQSFLRISNSGTVAGAATITAIDAEGTTVGSFTTPSIPVNGQIQISNVALEQGDDTYTGLGISAGVTGQYTVLITGPFQGYVQHVQLNNNSLSFTNLSGFRGSSGSGNQIP